MGKGDQVDVWILWKYQKIEEIILKFMAQTINDTDGYLRIFMRGEVFFTNFAIIIDFFVFSLFVDQFSFFGDANFSLFDI